MCGRAEICSFLEKCIFSIYSHKISNLYTQISKEDFKLYVCIVFSNARDQYHIKKLQVICDRRHFTSRF